MSDEHTRKQAKILSLTLRILILTQRVSQSEVLRAARIAAEVRSERSQKDKVP